MSTSRCFRCCGRSSATGCAASSPAIGPRPAISCCAPEASGPLLLFKALQLLQCRGMADPLQDYVAFDLETTEKDPAECEIVELAAVRVRGRVIVEQFQRLVRPSRPITPQATAVHGYRDADVCDEPTLAEVWPAFREFVGGDLLVAHNGHTFDVPVLRRLADGLPGLDELVFFDTLPLARSLMDDSAAAGGPLPPVRRVPRAARITRSTTPPPWRAWCGIWASSAWRARGRSALVQLLGWLGLALALDAARRAQRRRSGCSATSRCRPPSAGTAAASRRTPSRPRDRTRRRWRS